MYIQNIYSRVKQKANNNLPLENLKIQYTNSQLELSPIFLSENNRINKKIPFYLKVIK